jgi:hypothetical protein
MFSSKLCLLLASFVAIVLLSAVSLIALALAGCGVVHSAPPQANSPAPQGMFVQSKACVRSTTGTAYALPCTLDNPVTEGDLLVLAQQGGSNPYDNLGNVWLPVPNNNTFNYVLNAKSGVTTVNTPSGAGPFGGAAFAIIAEYQPVVNIDTFQRPDGTVQPSFSFGSYSNQNLETPQGRHGIRAGYHRFIRTTLATCLSPSGPPALLIILRCILRACRQREPTLLFVRANTGCLRLKIPSLHSQESTSDLSRGTRRRIGEKRSLPSKRQERLRVEV